MVFLSPSGQMAKQYISPFGLIPSLDFVHCPQSFNFYFKHEMMDKVKMIPSIQSIILKNNKKSNKCIGYKQEHLIFL